MAEVKFRLNEEFTKGLGFNELFQQELRSF